MNITTSFDIINLVRDNGVVITVLRVCSVYSLLNMYVASSMYNRKPNNSVTYYNDCSNNRL